MADKTTRQELEELLHFHRTQALFTRGSLLEEHRKAISSLERRLIVLDRAELTPRPILGQTRWTRPWMKGRVTNGS